MVHPRQWKKTRRDKVEEKLASVEETSSQALGSVVGVASREGKFLTFRLGVEHYGIEILKVQEIIGMLPITDVPRTPAFIKGVINLRGKVIPVTDLRVKFGMSSIEYSNRTCIIVVQIIKEGKEATMGLIVDEVSEVVDIAASQMEPPPDFGQSVDVDFIFGMGKVDSRVVMLIEVDRVLANVDMKLLSDSSKIKSDEK